MTNNDATQKIIDLSSYYSLLQNSSFSQSILYVYVREYKFLFFFFFFPRKAAAAKSLLSCPILCDPRDGSPPGSPVPEILQARTLKLELA